MHTDSSSRRLMLEPAAFTLAMSARATSTPAGVGLMGQAASWPHDLRQHCGIYIVKSLRTLHSNNRDNPNLATVFLVSDAF